MKDRFYLIVCVALAVALGYSLASKPADASGTGSVADSIYRVANSLERIELLLTKKP